MFEIRKDIFCQEIVDKSRMCRELAKFRTNEPITPVNISTSGDFADSSKKYLEDRLAKFCIDNVILIEGVFEETVTEFFSTYKGKVFSANIDCDLYEGYKAVLPCVYRRSSTGSMLYLDEYYSLKFPGARIAVTEFLDGKEDELCQLQSFENEFERWAIIKK
jgi:hypothetical protein